MDVFFIPEILNQYNKVIYSDADVIYKEDIADLMLYNLDDNYIGAAVDFVEEILRRQRGKNNRTLQFERLGVFNEHRHINAGILLINVKKWLEDDVKGKLLDILSEEVFSLADQDAINVICKNKITFLDAKWNVPVRLDWILPKISDLQMDPQSLYPFIEVVGVIYGRTGRGHSLYRP